MDTDSKAQEKLPWDLQESYRLVSRRTNTGRKITGVDGVEQRGREGWTLLLVTGSSVATPETKLRAGGRICVCQKVLSIIKCFSARIRKGNWKTGMDSRENEEETSEEKTPKAVNRRRWMVTNKNHHYIMVRSHFIASKTQSCVFSSPYLYRRFRFSPCRGWIVLIRSSRFYVSVQVLECLNVTLYLTKEKINREWYQWKENLPSWDQTVRKTMVLPPAEAQVRLLEAAGAWDRGWCERGLSLMSAGTKLKPSRCFLVM